MALSVSLLGKEFGRWRVIGPSPIRGRRLKWRCRCECGTERDVQGTNLRLHRSLGCGCVNLGNRIRPFEALYNYFLTRLRGYDVSVSYEDFIAFTTVLECHYCGADITWSEYHPTKNGCRYNLDRKDNSVGYHKENIVVCCSRCNRAKLDHFTYEQFMEIALLIRKWENRCLCS